MIPLKTAALVLAYNQEEYLAHCLDALEQEVELAVAVQAEAPFCAYNPAAREQFQDLDGTADILREAGARWPGLHVVRGRWEAEEPMRDAGLARLRQLGVQLCLVVDADEFYPQGALTRLQAIAAAAPRRDRVYWAPGRHLFRGLDRLVVGGPEQRLPVAFHVTPESRFVRCRVPTGQRQDLPADLSYWHAGYVSSDARMWEKINTFGHAHEVVAGWYEEKWLGWTPGTTDLCRKRPERWPRTERIDPRRLPPALRRHRYFALALAGQVPR